MDDQTLVQHGWPVRRMVSQHPQQSLVTRMRSLLHARDSGTIPRRHLWPATSLLVAQRGEPAADERAPAAPSMLRKRNGMYSREIGMSSNVEATALRHRDLFALPNGSIYETRSHGTTAGTLQARLWCAHPPDPITFNPPHIDLTPGQTVQLLSRDETRSHTRHDGYVRAVFEQEMERRVREQMQLVDARTQRAQAEARERERALRSWWKKLFW